MTVKWRKCYQWQMWQQHKTILVMVSRRLFDWRFMKNKVILLKTRCSVLFQLRRISAQNTPKVKKTNQKPNKNQTKTNKQKKKKRRRKKKKKRKKKREKREVIAFKCGLLHYFSCINEFCIVEFKKSVPLIFYLLWSFFSSSERSQGTLFQIVFPPTSISNKPSVSRSKRKNAS